MVEPGFEWLEHVNFFSGKGLYLRNGLERDVPELKRLVYEIYDDLLPRLREWYEEHPGAFEREFYGPTPENQDTRIALVLEREGVLVGVGLLLPKLELDEPTTGEISKLYLHRSLRGQHIGSTFLKLLMEYAPRRGFDQLYLTSRVEFEDAIRLYERYGFVEDTPGRYDSPRSISMRKVLDS